MDRRVHRGRGAAARVLLDQGVRPAVQRQVPRRQVLPLPRGDDGRRVPPRPGDARCQAQGHPLLRALRPRLGDPRDPRPAAAGVPRAHLLLRGLQAGRPGRPPVPARLHRQVLGPLRRPGQPRGAPGDRRGLLRLHGRQHHRVSSSASSATWPPRPRSSSSSRRLGSATTSSPSGKALEKSAVVLGDDTDADVFALEDDGLEVAVQVFHVRGGTGARPTWLGGRRWTPRPSPRSSATSSSRCMAGSPVRACPARCSSPCCPTTRRPCPQWLGSLRGSNVDLRVPQRGDKRTLLETVHRNAKQSLARHKLARAGDLTARSVALQQLQETLDLGDAPLRVECYDISHIQGSQVVGSMVVFEDGLARKSEYRRFVIRGEQVDDTAAMDEVLTRRFSRYLEERDQSSDLELGPDPEAGPGADRPRHRQAQAVRLPAQPRRRRRWPAPGQRGARRPSRRWASTTSPSSVSPSGSRRSGCPARTTRSSCRARARGSTCCSGVRDEAHRFAITFHRQRRSKAMTASVLDGIPGLGETRRKALLRHFGSVKKIRAASAEELSRGFRHRTCAGGHDCGRVGLAGVGHAGGQPDDRRDHRRGRDRAVTSEAGTASTRPSS